MGVNTLPKIVTRQHRDCDLNPGPSAPESSTLTTRLPSHPYKRFKAHNLAAIWGDCKLFFRGRNGENSPSPKDASNKHWLACVRACVSK